MIINNVEVSKEEIIAALAAEGLDVVDKIFEYPIYKKRLNWLGYTVMFTSLKEFEHLDGNVKGVKVKSASPHTDTDTWQDCPKPRWVPTEPTWCLVSAGKSIKHKRLVVGVEDGIYESVCDTKGSTVRAWTKAEPCEEKDIPQFWKDMKATCNKKDKA